MGWGRRLGDRKGGLSRARGWVSDGRGMYGRYYELGNREKDEGTAKRAQELESPFDISLWYFSSHECPEHTSY